MRRVLASTSARIVAAFAFAVVTAPAWAQTVEVVEFHDAARDHYFVSSLAADIEAIDSGKFKGWVRTGASFRAWASPAPGSSPVCRFYIPPERGDSHFYSASPAECAQTASRFPSFVLESSAVMHVDLPHATTGACPVGDLPVYRVWNNRADSNHRYTTSLAVRDQMVARGWIAEGYGPDAVIMCAPAGGSSQLLVRAWDADGTEANVGDFARLTTWRNGNAVGYQNYGLFALGTLPGTPQIGSDLKAGMLDGVPQVAFDVPADQPFYFTALWRAPVIGTVFMRADNDGAGLMAKSGRPQTIEIPYHFALSEYAQALREMPAAPLPADLAAQWAQATAAIDAAKAAPTPAGRAQAAYTALSLVMPVKERFVVEASNRAIAAAGRRSDFDLNYEGFGSWTFASTAAGYAMAKDAGFESVYTIVDWKIVSPVRGTYDFTGLDYQIDQARAQGFKVALQINWNAGSVPAWIGALPFDEMKALYFDNARRVVSRYGDKVSVYYACGEMELSPGTLTLEQVAELARESLAGARAASPTTRFGIYTSASAYVNYQINRVPAADYYSGTTLLAYLFTHGVDFDFVALQMQYGTFFANIDIQRFAEVLRQTHEIVKVPIIMGETGASTKTQDYGIAAQSAWHDALTQQTQYEWADGTVRALYALPFVQGYYWVHLDPDDLGITDPAYAILVGASLLRADGTVKKARTAFRDFTTWVKGLPPR